MLRIGILFEFATLNGGEYSMLSVIERLRGAFEFVALAPPHGRLADRLAAMDVEHQAIQLRDAEGKRLDRPATLELLESHVTAAQVDLLHANSLSMGRLTGALDIAPCPRRVAHLRDIIKVSKATIADLNRNDTCLAVSQATKAFHVAQGLDSERTRVVHNGVDCDRFRKRPRTGDLRRELGLSEDAFLIATIGQIGLRKGQDVLALAAPTIVRRASHAHFILIGERNSSKQESRDFEAAIASRFESNGLGSRLYRLGYREDIHYLLNELDLLVHPAHQEPLGRVLLEAAASELPIVATAVGGTCEIVTDEESARLVPANAPEELADAIIELYLDEPRRIQFASAARNRIQERFNIQLAANRLAEVWHDLGRR